MSTASAWVWSTHLNGTIAWRIASTDGDGAAGSIVRDPELPRHVRVREFGELGERKQLVHPNRREIRLA